MMRPYILKTVIYIATPSFLLTGEAESRRGLEEEEFGDEEEGED